MSSGIEYRKFITRVMLQEEREKLFVFGDNLERRGFGGQAKAMRGEPNAIGIPTKRLPTMDPEAFLNDGDILVWLCAIYDDYQILLNHQGMIIWPAEGIGTGRARLKLSSPMIWRCVHIMRVSLSKYGKG